MLAGKIIFLFIAVWFSIVNFGSLYQGEGVLALNTILQSAGITIFVLLQWFVKQRENYGKEK